MFAEINVITSSNTANVDVGTLPECIPCKIYSYTKMCSCMLFMPKLRSCVLTTTFRIKNQCTTHVQRIPYMFEEINAFTSLNTANIYVGTLPCAFHASFWQHALIYACANA